MKDRLMAVVAIATVAVIALAGVGYAAYSGIMTTQTGTVDENHLQVTWDDSILDDTENTVQWNCVTTYDQQTSKPIYTYKIADTTLTIQGTQKSANTAGVVANPKTSNVQSIGTTDITVKGSPAANTYNLYIKADAQLYMGTSSQTVDLWFSTDSGTSWTKITTTAAKVGSLHTLESGTFTDSITIGITQTEDSISWTGTIPSSITGTLTIEALYATS